MRCCSRLGAKKQVDILTSLKRELATPLTTYINYRAEFWESEGGMCVVVVATRHSHKSARYEMYHINLWNLYRADFPASIHQIHSV